MIEKKNLKKFVKKHGVAETVRQIKHGLKKKHFKPEDLSIRDLAEAMIVGRNGESVGRSWVERLAPRKSGGYTLLESSSGVQMSGFLNISGQIFYNRLMEGYQQAEFISDMVTTTIQTDLNGEKIAGLTGVTESVDVIKEGMPYPETGFGEDYIETPMTDKYGLIISVTKETIFFDRTNMVLNRASRVGEVLARRKEKAVQKMIWGLTNNYKRRGTSYNTYLTSGNWINKRTGVTLTDWTTLDASEQLFADLLEPNTGEPIIINPSTIIHMPSLRHKFRQIIQSTTVETLTDSGNSRRFGPNTLDPYKLIQTKFGYRELINSGISAANAGNHWLIGEPKKAFAYMQNWPITVVQAPNNSEPEFKQDIVLRWKASERGVPAVMDPRYIQLVYNAQ